MKTILYVEDDEHDVFFLNRAFSAHAPSFRVQTVHSIEDAISYLQGASAYADRTHFPPADLIISDVSIPGGSGYQLLSWVRKSSQFSRLPFILLSGSAQDAQIEKVAGADFCLEKSIDFKELLAKVTKLLGAD